MSEQSKRDPDSIILGIDPGTLITGYGFIRVVDRQYSVIDYGCIRPPTRYKLSDRYLIIFESLEELIEKHRPTAVAIETQYVHRNVQSALKIGMARGIAIVAAKKKNLPVFEYAPAKAKSAVVGHGRASKYQVQGMVQKRLNLKELPHPEDAADALALAICHAQTADHLLGKVEI